MHRRDIAQTDDILDHFQYLKEEAQQAISPKQLPVALVRLNEETKHLESERSMLYERLRCVNTQLTVADCILSRIHQAVLFVNRQGHILTYNLAAEKILKVKQKKALFAPYWKSFEDDTFGFSMRIALKNLKTPRPHHTFLFDISYDVRSVVIKRGDPSQFGIMILLRPTSSRRLKHKSY